MPTERRGHAADFLLHRADLVASRARLTDIQDVLIIAGQTSPFLAAIIRLMFGYELSVRTAASTGAALDALTLRQPDLVFLDHALPPGMPAQEVIPLIRRCGFAGPLIVTASGSSPHATRALLEAGAADVIDRDELDSARIAEALLHARLPDTVAAE